MIVKGGSYFLFQASTHSIISPTSATVVKSLNCRITVADVRAYMSASGHELSLRHFLAWSDIPSITDMRRVFRHYRNQPNLSR